MSSCLERGIVLAVVADRSHSGDFLFGVHVATGLFHHHIK